MKIAKKSMVVLMVVLLGISLVACGTKPATTTTTETEKKSSSNSTSSSPKPLEIVESGWSVLGDGDLTYGIVIKNPNKKYSPASIEINMTIKDAEGKILGTSSSYPGAIAAGDTIQYGDTAYVSEGTPTEVEFKVVVDKYNWKDTANKIIRTEQLVASNVNLIEDSYSASITGELENTSELDSDYGIVCVIFRNSENKIIAGFSTSANLLAGEKSAFEIYLFNKEQLPADATYEVFALPPTTY